MIEEREQPEYLDCKGEQAEPTMRIMGVYAAEEKARREMEFYIDQDKKTAEQLGTDPNSYYIDERKLS
jgi:hypothetical protein